MASYDEMVYIDKLSKPKGKQPQLDRNLADEHRIKDIAQWLIEENASVSIQTVTAIVKSVIYNEDDLSDTDEQKGPGIDDIGCIKVAPTIPDFPIYPKGGWVYPLDAQVRSYPIVGETVIIANYNGRTYYFQPLNLKNSVTHNIMLNADKTGAEGNKKTSTENISEYLKHFQYAKNPRPVKQFPGDWALNGRNDQSIRVGTNTQKNNEEWAESHDAVIKIRIAPESKASDAAAGTPRAESINDDKASIYLTRNEEVNHKIARSVETVTDISTMGAGAITLDSERIIFNTKDSNVSGQIDLFSGNTVNIVSKNNTNVIPGSTSLLKLGDVNDDNLQSAVLGENLVNFLAELISTLDGFAAKIAGIKGLGNIGTLVPIPEGMAAGAQLQGWTAATAKNQISNRILTKKYDSVMY